MTINSDTITVDVCKMFAGLDPWDCSNSVANLGDQAARLTWENSLRVAENVDRWMSSDIGEACEAIQKWAKDTGAWDAEEIAGWDDPACIALIVQNVASALRARGFDDIELDEMAGDDTSGAIDSDNSDGHHLYVDSDGVLLFDLYCGS